MGIKDEQLAAKRGRNVKAKEAQTDNQARFTKKQSEPCDITAVEAALVGQAIQRVVNAGDAIMLGMTSDGGALTFTVYSNGERTKDYAHSLDEMDMIFQAILDQYE